MDIFFQDPTEVPLPPAEVRIRTLRAEPWPDGQRVRVYLEVDPFQRRPNAEVHITNPQAAEVASADIIETMNRKMEFTMHLRGEKLTGQYTTHVTLFYSEPEENEGETEGGEKEFPQQVITVVDEAEAHFDIQ